MSGTNSVTKSVGPTQGGGASKQGAKQWIFLAIGLFLIFGFGAVAPTWSLVTRTGVQGIGIFVGVVFLTCTNFGLIMPALLGMFSIILTGYMSSKELIAATFGTSTIYQLILIYCLCQGINSSGAGQVIARWLISRKFAQGRPMVFTLMFLMACVFGGIFIGTTGTILFSYTILKATRDALGYESNSKWFKLMLMGCYTASCAGSPVLPFKGLALVIFGNVSAGLETAGIQVNYGAYMLSAAVMAILYTGFYALLLRFVFRVDMSKLKNFDINAMEGVGQTKLTPQQAIVLLGFTIGIAYTIVMIFLPESMPGYETIKGIGQCIWFSVVVAVLSIIRVDGQPVFEAKKCFRDGVTWDVVLAVCIFSVLGGMLSSADAGIQDWLNLILGPVFGGMPFLLFMIILIGATVIITNFFSNTATGLIIGTIASPFLLTYVQNDGINSSVVGAGLVSAAMFAYLTMAASGTAPLFLGEEAISSDPGFVWKNGTILILIYILFASIVFTFFSYIL